jgi:hypothetical protein
MCVCVCEKERDQDRRQHGQALREQLAVQVCEGLCVCVRARWCECAWVWVRVRKSDPHLSSSPPFLSPTSRRLTLSQPSTPQPTLSPISQGWHPVHGCRHPQQAFDPLRPSGQRCQAAHRRWKPGVCRCEVPRLFAGRKAARDRWVGWEWGEGEEEEGVWGWGRGGFARRSVCFYRVF